MEMGRVWEKEFELGIAPIFEKMCFDFMGKKTPKTVCPLPHAFMFSSSLMFWGVAGLFLIIHSSFTGSSHTTEPSRVFILDVFSCFLMVHSQEFHFGAME